jgi:MFS family permease
VNAPSRKIQSVYLILLLLHTLAASLIWGINTLFLLDGGLSNTEAFAANACFTAGLVLFEVPTGVIADTRGRRASYLLGTLTLTVSTLLYLAMWKLSAPFWAWALTSAFLGLGFTFFSGAVEAWLVDALTFTGYFADGGKLESVLAKGKIVEGAAMLCGSVAGGLIAGASNLGVPYVVRAVLLALTLAVAFTSMRDLGFAPTRNTRLLLEVKTTLRSSIEHGLANPPVRWVMLAAPFTGGVTLYAFYAMQPYLLELYGDEGAYGVAGLAAAIVAGAQILGGLLVPHIGRVFRRRTSVLLVGTMLSAILLGLIGLFPSFWTVIVLLGLWGLSSSRSSDVSRTCGRIPCLTPAARRFRCSRSHSCGSLDASTPRPM